ncbi:hypothetical protein GCM10010394_14290 [Streptomyces crystallinus]|uniref:Uncharacterized protein n=1 Tax=Streptomyces crystallinus TaxID=68191 RepID=A0ABP3QDN6_9ACTN
MSRPARSELRPAFVCGWVDGCSRPCVARALSAGRWSLLAQFPAPLKAPLRGDRGRVLCLRAGGRLLAQFPAPLKAPVAELSFPTAATP